jgi:hypothetical protein
MSSNYTFVNNVSATPINNNVAECNSWIQVDNNAGRPLFANASYITNLDNLSISLSSGNLDIGSVHVTDKDSGLAVTIADVGVGVGAMRVLSQDLEPVHDTVSLGDVNGNLAYVTNSALNVFTTNGISAVSVTNFPTQLTAVSVTNFPTQLTAVSVTNQLTSTSVTVLNPVSSFTLLNSSIEISNDIGNPVPVNVTNTIVTAPLPTQLDAFGRLRVSTPLTLFDSSHRYRDNNLWASLTAVGGTYAFNQNQGLMDLTVSGLSGSSVIRETTKVFAYQPGKSLLVMNTFVMASSATNLRQRVGYYGQDNGIYFQLDDGNIGLVKRSLVSGSVIDTVVLRSDWNGDKLDGTGASGLTLDITKAQIFWMDIEWLGVGSVRTGFIINGQYIVCHTFHHANLIASTYITTASLPVRYEITNKAATSGSKTLKQICSSVVSEGGYELRGLQQAVGTTITAPKALTTAGTHYPVVSIRLKASPNRLDAIVILTALSIMGVGTGIYDWRVIATGTTGGGGAWQDAGVDSAVEYKLDGTSITGGRILAQGYLTSTSSVTIATDILKEALFKFQLERNGLTGVPYELTIAVAASTNTELVHASMDWEEISR